MRVYAKAIVAFLTTLLGQLALVLSAGEGFTDVTTAEWITIASAVVVATAAVWGIPNADAGVPVEG